MLNQPAVNLPLNSFLHSLIKSNLVDANIAVTVFDTAHQKNQSVIFYLAENNLIEDTLLANAVAKHFQLSVIDLNNLTIDYNIFNQLDEKFLKKNLFLPLNKKEHLLQVAVVDPSNTQALTELQFYTGTTLQLFIANYHQLAQHIDALISKKQYKAIQNLKEIPTNIQHDEAPIIRFVDQILHDAIQKNASDIHFEPYENFYRIRMRIDGILYEMISPPITLGTRIAARVKIMAHLDISEKRLPQDGRFTITFAKSSRECRISTCPTLFGEKIVVRILDSANLILDIDALGFEEPQKKLFNDAIAQPQGMILVTGPTGSGKTVTLYTALNKLNLLEQNISTVEDPVEINLAGINQVNINPKIGLTFAHTLRAFLRQDPDIIMVGEIRDIETADIAIKAAQTGHLVLSTIHTNSAPDTLTRLMNMGIASFNIASSIVLIIAQRLVRRLCNACKKSQMLPESALLQQGFNKNEIADLKIFNASECSQCVKGYKGRIGIYEMLPITKEIAQMIMQQKNSRDVAELAKDSGMQTLRQSALHKVKQGLTSLEEINRIIGQL